MSTSNTLREQVRERYAQAAQIAEAGRSVIEAQACGCGDACCGDGSRDDGCCGDECCGGGTPGQDFGEALYTSGERAELPEAAALASLGCGNPTAVAELREGETVLDLGSGGGIDVILSARRVGPRGTAYGLDMTEEMLALATRNARAAGVSNAIFLRGVIEDVPLPADSVDVVISNCVINLSTDKPAVLREIARVVRPGGRIGISDVVADDELTVEDRAARGSYVGCIAGALSAAEYAVGLAAVGFADITIETTHQVADGMHAAIVRASRGDATAFPGRSLPLLATSGDRDCC
jgi:arsenite methyltransferase